jgi:hypothetical protein
MGISASLGSSALLPAGLGFRNVITNGGMQVAQRGSTFTFGSGSGALYYGADRWRTQDYTWSAGSNITVSNDSSLYPTGFSNSYKVATGATGLTFGSGGTLFIETSIEGYNASSLYGKSAYLSFWVRSSVTGIYNVLLENGSWGSATSTRIYTPEYTINSANTWEYKTIPIDFATATASGTWNRTNGKGIGVSFVLGAHADRTGDPYKSGWTTFSSYAGIKTSSAVSWGTNANATFNVTGVQLEQNYQPTPFEQRPIGVELALCQRYYWQWNSADSGENVLACGAQTGSTTSVFAIHLPVEMRSKPTVTIPAMYVSDQVTFSILATIQAATNTKANTKTLPIYVSHSSAGAQFRPIWFIALNASGTINASAEL